MEGYSKLTLYHPERLLDKMFSEVKDIAFILLNPEGEIVNWNAGAQFIKGYTREEAIGKHFRIFYTAEDQNAQVPEQLISEAHTVGKAVNEGWRVRKDGTLFWAHTVITALHDDDGSIIGFSKVTRDLTERKHHEDMLTAKNKELERTNQELSSFAYVASHDLQEPLRKIQTFTSRILELEKGKFSEKGQDFFSRLQNAAQRMEKLIHDLLMYSRTTTVDRKYEPVDLNELVTAVKSDLEVAINEKKAIFKSAKLPVINGIRFQLHQLFLNLFSNSLKFSRIGVPPKITIDYAKIPGDQLPTAKGSPARAYHYISVADNGIGFDQEYKEKIFEIFQRLHGKAEYSGTGIGLAICKKIVDNHSGIITAEGVVDEGAVFHLAFPAS